MISADAEASDELLEARLVGIPDAAVRMDWMDSRRGRRPSHISGARDGSSQHAICRCGVRHCSCLPHRGTSTPLRAAGLCGSYRRTERPACVPGRWYGPRLPDKSRAGALDRNRAPVGARSWPARSNHSCSTRKPLPPVHFPRDNCQLMTLCASISPVARTRHRPARRHAASPTARGAAAAGSGPCSPSSWSPRSSSRDRRRAGPGGGRGRCDRGS